MPISVAEEIRQLRSLFWSDRDPEGRVFAPLADAYRRQGDLAQAVDLIEEGLVRQMDFVPGHVVSAWVRRDQGQHEAAAIAFRAAFALDEQNVEAIRGLAELAALPVPASAPAAAPTAAPKSGSDDGPVTRTMADLYARQGLHDRALKVYRQLLERDPSDESLRTRVAELEGLAGTAGRGRELDVEKLARDWAAGPGDTGELSTPFAWTPALKSRPERAGPAVREYFRGLLAWEPGAEPAAATASSVAVAAEPEGTVVAIASLAPAPEAPPARDVVAVASLAPDATAIASLAPDAVPVASLAPDAVPVASLAPDAVPIASLAPDAVPIASLA